jgi:hypothetical protein
VTGAEILFIVQGIVALGASLVDLLQAKTPEDRDAILLALRQKRALLTQELDRLADEAEARIVARKSLE